MIHESGFNFVTILPFVFSTSKQSDVAALAGVAPNALSRPSSTQSSFIHPGIAALPLPKSAFNKIRALSAMLLNIAADTIKKEITDEIF